MTLTVAIVSCFTPYWLMQMDGCHKCLPSKGPLGHDGGWSSARQHCESAPEISTAVIAMMTQRCKHQYVLWGFGGNHIIFVDKDARHLLTSPQADKVHKLLLTLINFPAINKKVRHEQQQKNVWCEIQERLLKSNVHITLKLELFKLFLLVGVSALITLENRSVEHGPWLI